MSEQIQKTLKPLDPVDFFSKEAVAAQCGVSMRTVQNWMHRGGLAHCKIGSVVVILRDDMLEFLKTHRIKGSENGVTGD